jgi:hypothetical protein
MVVSFGEGGRISARLVLYLATRVEIYYDGLKMENDTNRL